MSGQRVFSKFVSLTIAITFLFSNLVFAAEIPLNVHQGYLNYKLSARTQIFSTATFAKQLILPFSFQEEIYNASIGNQADLVLQESRIKNQLIKSYRQKAEAEGIPSSRVLLYEKNILNSYPLFGLDRNKNKVTYLFNLEEGIFFRIEDKGKKVDDSFSAAFLDSVERIDFIDEVNGSNVEVYGLTVEMLPGINFCLRKLYGVAIPFSVVGTEAEEGQTGKVADPSGTKGEHVGHSYLVTELGNEDRFETQKKTVNAKPAHRAIIDRAIVALHEDQPEISSRLQSLVDAGKIKVVKSKREEKDFSIFLTFLRKMKYSVLAHVEDTIYIPQDLLEMFLSVPKFTAELKKYLGDEQFSRLTGDRHGDDLSKWLEKCFYGGLVHEGYEINKWLEETDSTNVETNHQVANVMEKVVAGNSAFDGESAFDDIIKFLILKDQGLKPDIDLFNVLRDRRRSNDDIVSYGLGYERHNLRDIEQKGVKGRLERLFDEATDEGETYHLIVFHGRVIGVSKRKADGTESVYEVYQEGTTIDWGGYQIKQLVEDYQYMAGRSAVPYAERKTLTYNEVREFEAEYNQKKAHCASLSPGPEKTALEAELKKDSIFLTGGKGRSLSIMDAIVDVPAGLTISTTAYFAFIRSRPDLQQAIDDKLGNLDAMDDRARQVIAKEIRDLIEATPIPPEIAREIALMYRHLDILQGKKGKPTPTATAVRSSGTSEDSEVRTWMPQTTGSQAGQADTYLNVRGEENVLEKVRDDWASLFTDRAISYRDDAVFFQFSARIGMEDSERKANFYRMLDKLREYGNDENKYGLLADTMTRLENPSSYLLLKALEDICRQEPDNEFIDMCRSELNDERQGFVNPLKLGIAVVLMQMAKSYLSGTAFNVDPSTGYGGKSRALWLAWKKNDKRFVHVDEKGNIVGTKSNLVSFEMNYGYGETVVGGLVDPDKYVMGTTDGEEWFVLEKRKGAKLVQMIDVEDSIKFLSNRVSEDEIRKLAAMLKKAVNYDEVSKDIDSIIASYINIKYLKSDDPDETEKQKKKRMAKIAGEIAMMIKQGEEKASIIEVIKEHFEVTEEEAAFGIVLDIVDELVGRLYDVVRLARQVSEEGRKDLITHFQNEAKADDFIRMAREVWISRQDKNISDRAAVLGQWGVNEREYKNFSYLLRSLIDKSFTALIVTSVNHQNSYTLTDEELHHVADMVSTIANAQEKDIDVEYAIEIDQTAPAGKRVEIVNMLEVDGRATGKVYARLYNVQARPYTAEIADIDLVVKQTELDDKFLKANKSKVKVLANGTKGTNASTGYVFRFDPSRDVGSQAEDIKRMKRGEFTEEERENIIAAGLIPEDFIPDEDNKDKVLPIILYLEEADPSHDPLMRICNAVVTLKGGETSHAAIFCREQRIPGIAGMGSLDTEHGKWIVADANNGKVYDCNEPWISYFKEHGKFPINETSFIVRPYLIPHEEGDPTIGYIMAAEKAAQEAAVTMLAPDAAGNSLVRAEFKGEELGINVIAGYGYDLLQKIQSQELAEHQLNEFQKDIVAKMKKHDWIERDIKKKLNIEGYSSFSEYTRKNYYYLYNNLGFAMAPDQSNKCRSYDFAQDKVAGMIGSEIFSWPGLNPLVGLRGAALEIKGVKDGEGGYQEVLGFILESLIEANENTQNQGWFYVFIRTTRELKTLTSVLKKVAEKKGKLPKEIGVMIEVPSNAILIEEFIEVLSQFQKDCEGLEVDFKKLFLSFGTNDYSHLAAKADREDRRMKLEIQDPAAQNAIGDVKDKGYFYTDGTDDTPGHLTLVDEGAEVIMQLIDTVVKAAREGGISTSLCGEAITQLLARGNYKAAGKIMSRLDSFGISMVNKRVQAAMLRYDTMRMQEQLTEEPGEAVFNLGDEKYMDRGVVKGEIVYVDSPEDLISDELKGLSGDELDKRIEFLRLNDPEKLSRVAGKVVVITKNLGTIEELEKRNILWDHLQYAKAIILDESVDEKEWDVFSVDKGIVAQRLKARMANLAGKRQEWEGLKVTIDYATGNVYEGDFAIEKIESEFNDIQVPTEEPEVEKVVAVKEDANNAYASMKFNPLALLAYRDGFLGTLLPKLEEHIMELVEEAKKIMAESYAPKREWSLRKFRERIALREERVIRGFLFDILKNGDLSTVDEDEVKNLAGRYIEGLKANISRTLGDQSVEDYIKEQFRQEMLRVAQETDGEKPIIHTMTSLNCRQLADLQGGFLTEVITPNPDYGLLGAARSIHDYWEVNRLELEAFTEVRQQYNNLGIQITELKGTQSGAVLMLVMAVFKQMGLVPGEDGLDVGVNISTPSDTLSVVRYIDEAGITFVTIDERNLGGAWLGADIEWKEEELVTDAEISDMGRKAAWIVKKVLKEKGIKLIELTEAVVDEVPVVAEDSGEVSREAMVSRIQDHQGELNLVVGCHNGYLANELASKNPELLVVGVLGKDRELEDIPEENNSLSNLIYIDEQTAHLLEDNIFARVFFKNLKRLESTNDTELERRHAEREFGNLKGLGYRLSRPNAVFHLETSSVATFRVFENAGATQPAYNDAISIRIPEQGLSWKESSRDRKEFKGIWKPTRQIPEGERREKIVKAHTVFKDKPSEAQVPIWEARFQGKKLVDREVLNEGLMPEIDLPVLHRALNVIGTRHNGQGIFYGADKLRIVSGLSEKPMEGKVPYAMIIEEDGERVLLLDSIAFKGLKIKRRAAGRDLEPAELTPIQAVDFLLDHEFREGIMSMLPYPNEVTRELTANFASVKMALESGIADIDELESLPPDFRFLEIVKYIAMEEVTEDKDIIGLLLLHMKGSPYYENLSSELLSLDDYGTWLDESRMLESRFKAAINVFGNVAEARAVVSGVQSLQRQADVLVELLNDLTSKPKFGEALIADEEALRQFLRNLNGEGIEVNSALKGLLIKITPFSITATRLEEIVLEQQAAV